jgi:hypothetical protein
LIIQSITFVSLQRDIYYDDIIPADIVFYGGDKSSVEIEGNLFVLDNVTIKAYDLRRFIPLSLGIDDSIMKNDPYFKNMSFFTEPEFIYEIHEERGSQETGILSKDFYSEIDNSHLENAFGAGHLEIELILRKNSLYQILFWFFFILYLIIPYFTSKNNSSKNNFYNFSKSYFIKTGMVFITWVAIIVIWASDSIFILLSAFIYYILALLISSVFYTDNKFVKFYKSFKKIKVIRLKGYGV